MTVAIREARFCVIDEDGGGMTHDAEPLEFDRAYQKASTQTHITRFLHQGIVAEPTPGS